ncbi:MAG: ABC transporter substrate-binding protein [Deltaproteobacteria bacterium]|jgi:branched-chain amino acid transport system substrate-binding protein|nr:ABC transporter substrate-binding protein [Deltaproteobacteria bacterium]
MKDKKRAAGAPAGRPLTRRQFLGLSAAAAASAALAPSILSSSRLLAADKEIRLGTIFPMTGNMAFGGNEGFTGTDIAREIINERGGINGKRIVFVKADAPDQTAATNEMNRLISKERLKLVIGSYSSAIAYTASAVAERNRVVFWENHGVADDIVRRGFKYLFKTNINATGTGGGASTFAAKYLAPKLGIPVDQLKVGIVWEDGTYGSSVGRGITALAKQNGLKIVANESYSTKSADLSPVVLKLRSAHPDVLLAAGIGSDAILFWKQARDLDLNVKAVVAASGGWGVLNFAQNLGSSAEGVFSSDFPTDVNPRALTPESAELQKEFVKRFVAIRGSRPTGKAYLAFAGTILLFQHVLPKADSLDQDQVRAAALALDLPEGSMVNGCGCKFEPPDSPEAGFNSRSFSVVLQWQKGEVEVVWPDKYANFEPILVPLPAWSARPAV